MGGSMSDTWGEAWGASTTSSCASGVCGTGGGVVTLPGDPNNNSVLTATPEYGGIVVSWTYPTINPHGVGTIHVYRASVPVLALAVRRTIATGDQYYDRIPASEQRQYYYWIYIVSVNGTVGEVIGPATAVPMLTIEETILDLTGKIDARFLAETLRTEIDRIEVINRRVTEETTNRLLDITTVTHALSLVQEDSSEVAALLQTETALRVESNSALASSVAASQVVMNNNIATAKTQLETQITSVEGKVQSIGALYTAKVDVNGLVGGFGIYNDGTFVEAGFDVDRFWIGRTSSKTKPFIIDNGVVYLDKATIQDGSIENAKIGNVIQSIDFTSGAAGWKIDKTGSVELNDAVFRGTLATKSAASGARTEITNDVIKVFGATGNLLIKLGNLDA